MREFIDHLTERNFANRTVALIENGSWAPLAAKVMKGMLEGCKDLTFTEAGIPYSRFEEMARRATGGDTFKLGTFVPLTSADILDIYHSAI